MHFKESKLLKGLQSLTRPEPIQAVKGALDLGLGLVIGLRVSGVVELAGTAKFAFAGALEEAADGLAWANRQPVAIEGDGKLRWVVKPAALPKAAVPGAHKVVTQRLPRPLWEGGYYDFGSHTAL